MYAVYNLASAFEAEGPLYRAREGVSVPVSFVRTNGTFVDPNSLWVSTEVAPGSHVNPLLFTDRKSAELFAAVYGNCIVGHLDELVDNHALIFTAIASGLIEDIKRCALDEFTSESNAIVFDVKYEGCLGYSNKLFVTVIDQKGREVYDVEFAIGNDNVWYALPEYYFDFVDTRLNEALTAQIFPAVSETDDTQDDDGQDEEEDADADDDEEYLDDYYGDDDEYEEVEDDDDDEEDDDADDEAAEPVVVDVDNAPVTPALTAEQMAVINRVAEQLSASVAASFANVVAGIVAATKK